MNNSSKYLNVFILLLVVGALIFLSVGLFGEPEPEEIGYSQVIDLFQKERVKSFVWKEGTLTLTIRGQMPEEGKEIPELSPETGENQEEKTTKVIHKLADVEMFTKDCGSLYKAQQKAGIVEEFEFVQVKQASWFLTMLPSLLLIAACGVALYFIMRRTSGNGGAIKFSRANARVGTGEQRITFADVAGADEEKEELQEVVDFLRNPDKYSRMGAKIPRGVLLVGPPGTGKTLIAKAVAGEAGVQFLSISGSDFVEMYVGVGASRVRDLFDQAKKGAPSIIFIDEIDAVGRHRGAGLGGGHDEREQTLNQLLVEMDGFTRNDGVIVMAATNRHDILDPALLRPGRFDRQIFVNPPDVKGREEVLRVHARDKMLAEDVDLKVIARATGGFTGADLANLLNEAALRAARENIPAVTMDILENSILKVVAGPEKRSRVQREQDRRITAYHEAGHAIAMHNLPLEDPVQQITIVPRGRALGMTVSLPEEDSSHWTRNEMKEHIISLLGGRVAAALEFKATSPGASNDLQRASRIARDMVAKYGMSERLGAVAYDDEDEVFVGRSYERTKSYSEHIGAEIDEEVKSVMRASYVRCEEILKENYDKLREVAEYLLLHEHMSRNQFEACMKGEAIPEKAESFFEDAARRVQEEKTASVEQTQEGKTE